MNKNNLLKIVGFALILTMVCLDVTAAVVTPEMAVNRVKFIRENNEVVMFSYALVNQVETDSFACDLTGLPSESWLHDNSPKWLVFAAAASTALTLTPVTSRVPMLTIPFPAGSRTLAVNASQLPQGVYIATLLVSGQTVASEQLVKQ